MVNAQSEFLKKGSSFVVDIIKCTINETKMIEKYHLKVMQRHFNENVSYFHCVIRLVFCDVKSSFFFSILSNCSFAFSSCRFQVKIWRD